MQSAIDISPHGASGSNTADLVGRDGIVYPDWRYAGVLGGISGVEVRALASDLGARPEDDRDDSPALAERARAVARMGGGALLLGVDTYHLNAPVVITDDNVVIRGRGAGSTTLVFRYRPSGQLAFFRPAEEGSTVGPDSWIEVHAAPREAITEFVLEVDGREVYRVPEHLLENGVFVLRTTGDVVTEAATDGRHLLTAAVEWRDGRTQEQVITVHVSSGYRLGPGKEQYPIHPKASVSALLFVGDKTSGTTWNLAADAKRGDHWLELTEEPDLVKGDAVVLYAPATSRWNGETGNTCAWGEFRRYEFQVASVVGHTVVLNQPLRIDYPVVDGPTLQKIYPIRRCGVEDVSLVQTEKLWTSGVLFVNAWGCWARGVEVLKAGRHPVYIRCAKWCEIRDCRFEDA